MPNAVGEAAISAVIPAAESVRNSVACVRIAATPHRPRRKPTVMPLVMQFTWLGPGVVTKTTQKSAKIVQPSHVMARPSIDRRGDHPDRHDRVIIRVGPGIGFATKPETVARPDSEMARAYGQVQTSRDDVSHLLRGALRGRLHLGSGAKG